MASGKDKIDVSRRRFLTGAFGRYKDADKAPVSSTSESLPVLKQAEQAFEAENYEEAVTAYKTFLKGEPSNMQARQRLGLCLYHQGRLVQAKIEFERVLKHRVGDNEALLYLGLTLASLGKLDKAVKHWKKHFDPERIPVQRELNVQTALLEGEDPPSAEEVVADVEKAIAQDKALKSKAKA